MKLEKKTAEPPKWHTSSTPTSKKATPPNSTTPFESHFLSKHYRACEVPVSSFFFLLLYRVIGSLALPHAPCHDTLPPHKPSAAEITDCKLEPPDLTSKQTFYLSKLITSAISYTDKIHQSGHLYTKHSLSY